jgi:uncharacterized protein (TIGR00730 family)
MSEIQSVAVFCGSNPGDDPVFRRAAESLGDGLARSGRTVVFGGGRIGLMGALADAALKAGGRVIGVIPDFLTRREVAHPGVSELIVTNTMHARKTRMFELADAFVTMPGGLGTFDETFEIITWRQLGLHDKPILICDVAGWAQPLVALLDATIARGFAAAESRRLYKRIDGVPALLGKLAKLGAPAAGEAALL